MLKLQSVLNPIRNMAPERVDSLEEAALTKLQEIAERDLGDDKSLVIRDLIPSDLGLTYEVWFETTGATANTWENSDIADKTVADERFIVIWGIIDASETIAVSAIRFTVGGSQVAKWSLDKLAMDPNRQGAARSPIFISQNTDITIEHYVKVANSGTELIFVGAVCEREGKVLKP